MTIQERLNAQISTICAAMRQAAPYLAVPSRNWQSMCRVCSGSVTVFTKHERKLRVVIYCANGCVKWVV